MQSRKSSFIEAGINVFIGFWINYVANLVILPIFGLHITLTENFYLGLMYTGIAVTRTYVIRRWFNARIHKAAQTITGEK